MPKLFVFAIGGTGERVMRSLTMVLASGAPAFDGYDVYPIIIDYDADNADKLRTVGLLQKYAAVHDAAFTRHGQTSNATGISDQFFAARLRNVHGLENYVFPFKPATPNEKFRKYIGYDNLAGENQTDDNQMDSQQPGGTLGTAELLESLYDKSDRADTELNLDMTVGFKGNPNIGSVVFHSIGDTPEFRSFRNLFKPAAGDKVAIIGSLFGGTGASGIPEIVKAIDALQTGAKIATILVLPYFHPMEKPGGAIQGGRFNSKTKAALSFYQDSGIYEKIDKVYYVGDFYPTTIPYSEGGVDQKNRANIVELIAALMVDHYVSGRGDGQKYFRFSLATDITVTQNATQRGSQRLFISDFDATSRKADLNHIVALSLGLKCLHDEIMGESDTAKRAQFWRILDMNGAVANSDMALTATDSPLKRLCRAMNEFYAELQAWMKELDFEGEGDRVPANSHRLALCDMTRRYADIILKEAVRQGDDNSSPMKKIAAMFANNREIDADFILTRISNSVNAHLAQSPDTKLGSDNEPEWAFADSLHSASTEAFVELTK